ncbi:MAG: murein biosynthesis integral membrane protein MurJ [Planctomycetes bacterium]|nr:murein biosynthesis integral membrane protein MurJ [Planctomycetota bacterium]
MVGGSAAPAGSPGRPRHSVLRAAGLVSGLTLVSRVLGLARDALTTHALGRSIALDTFIVAWMLPNMLRRLFGEGALAAALVPELTRRRERDGDDAARRLLGAVTWALLVGLGGLVALVVAATLVLPPGWWAEGDAERGALLATLLATLFPYALPICLLATWSGALNVLGRFAPGAGAPALLNIVWIGALLVGMRTFGDDQGAIVRLVAVALLVGGVVQLATIARPLRREGFLPRPVRPRADDGSRAVFRTMLPTVVGMSALQINVLVDQSVAWWLCGDGANSSLYLANRLLLFPHALVALPLATAAFPRLAVHASRNDLGALREQLDRAIRFTAFLALPAAVGMALVAEDLIRVAFEHGAFAARDTDVTCWTTAALVASLPAIGSAQLMARAMYALSETRAPARIALWLVLVNAALDIVLTRVVHLDAPGLALATTATAWLNLVLLHRALGRQSIQPPRASRRAVLRTGAATAAMCAAVLGVRGLVEPVGRLELATLGLAMPIALGAAVFALAHHALGGQETRTLLRRLARRA